ncbi:MAG: 30S ribosomal protein S1 [Candidatus Omnitrophica bacterium]|nr:30S ribosomal protein S1 [Candidatus Omnitrophota bacterium]
MTQEDQVNLETLDTQSTDATGLQIDYDATFKNFKEGEVVKGHVLRITEASVLVDIGYKSEGQIPAYEFRGTEGLAVGDEVDVYIEEVEDEEGACRLSRRKAEKSRGWEQVVSQYGEGDIMKARVARKVKGGLMADLGGVEAFLPASLAFLKGFGNLNLLVGQEFEVKIIKINPQRHNIIVSRKDVLEKEKQESKEKVISELEVGVVRSGVVKNITDFGAFVNLGGIDGLLHITDMSWGRVNHPTEVLKVGDKVDVQILSFDKESMKVSLGLKQLQPNPWDDVDMRFPIGSRTTGRVVNVMPYGIFVEIERGVEGLVHVSEMSWSKRNANPGDLFKAEDQVDVMVLSIDKASQKISLGIRQTAENPWIGIEERYPVGTRIRGTVWNLTDFGAFVQVEDGIDGLIHISDMSWTKKVSHPREALKKGDEVEAVVLNVDQIKRKLSLGLKQMLEDPWIRIAERYPSGTIAEGVVTKTATFGVFVEIESDIEGLLHISEMNQDQATHLDENFPAETKLQVRILKIDSAAHKIALSLKGIS